jgi:hypothetical protein
MTILAIFILIASHAIINAIVDITIIVMAITIMAMDTIMAMAIIIMVMDDRGIANRVIILWVIVTFDTDGEV